MALIKNNEVVDDPFVDAAEADTLPASGPVIVSVEQWQAHRADLVGRGAAVGVRLRSEQSPELIAGDLEHLAVVALEFPKFRDGRAYSYARLLRERYGFNGEVRAVGDVLMEQLHFMIRTGFDAFDLNEGDDPLGAFRAALADFSVWYQPTGDGRPTALQLRHRR